MRRFVLHFGQGLGSKAAAVRCLCASLRASASLARVITSVIVIHVVVIVALELSPVHPPERHADRREVEGVDRY